MSYLTLQSLLLGLVVFSANAVQVQPTQKLEGEIKTNPRPTPRAVVAVERLNLVDRQYYNALCGYANGNISLCSSASLVLKNV